MCLLIEQAYKACFIHIAELDTKISHHTTMLNELTQS